MRSECVASGGVQRYNHTVQSVADLGPHLSPGLPVLRGLVGDHRQWQKAWQTGPGTKTHNVASPGGRVGGKGATERVDAAACTHQHTTAGASKLPAGGQVRHAQCINRRTKQPRLIQAVFQSHSNHRLACIVCSSVHACVGSSAWLRQRWPSFPSRRTARRFGSGLFASYILNSALEGGRWKVVGGRWKVDAHVHVHSRFAFVWLVSYALWVL